MKMTKIINFLCAFLIVFCVNTRSASSNSKVISLNEDNWRELLENEWMVEFYAPWCPACKNLAPSWEKLASWSNDLSIKTAQIDVTISPALSGRFLVTALPTIYHVLNGEFRQYRGTRDADSLISFVEDQKWRDLEPISQWKDPDSIQMAIVSYFFKLSHYLKELNNVMLVEYGFPAWATYVLFAIATILLGALLGLILVSIIDLIFPPVPQNSRKSFAQTQVADAGSTDEVRDELEDDQEKNKDEDESSSSDDEKYSGSDDSNEEDEDDVKVTQKEAKGDDKKPPSPEVRKRKTRKAD